MGEMARQGLNLHELSTAFFSPSLFLLFSFGKRQRVFGGSNLFGNFATIV
jgi:hypothetical protein